MIDRAVLSEEHDRLDAIAIELLALVDRADGPTPALSALRWRLSRTLLMHLAKEDKHLYPMLEGFADPRVAETARRFSREMGGLATAYGDYVQRWTAGAVAADWPAFANETRKLLGALRHRILREERDLYPLIAARSASASAAVSPTA